MGFKNNTHSIRIIELLNQNNIISAKLITLRGGKYGCADHYRCATTLYLFSILSQVFYVIIQRGISAPGHGIEVVDGLDATEKRFFLQLMSNVKLPGAKGYDTQMAIYNESRTSHVSLDR